jgi:hypothetical protein
VLEGFVRLGEFVGWSEEVADAVRIAVGAVRERLVRGALVAWKEGPSMPPSCSLYFCSLCVVFAFVVLVVVVLVNGC